MKTSIYLLLLLSLLSCAEEKISSLHDCREESIPEGTPWYDSFIGSLDCTCEHSVFKADYKERTAYYVLITDPLCCGIFTTTLYDCKSETIKNYGESDWLAFIEEVTSSEVIYRCKATRE